jgi:TolA-binding protein
MISRPSAFLPALLSVFTVLLAAAPRGVEAQAPASPEALLQQASTLYERGDYKGASQAAETILKDFSTSQAVPPAQYLAGSAHYRLGEYGRAIELFRKILGPPATEDIQERGFRMLPQALSARAGTLPVGSEERKAAFGEAINGFSTYLNKFPKSEEVDLVRYQRALAHVNIGNFREAAADLEANLQQFPTSPSTIDSKYLLTVVQTSQARTILAEGGSEADALKLLETAEKYLQEIVEKGDGLALENDCYFQLGEIYLLRGTTIPRTNNQEREATFEKALGFYRRVKSKDLLVEAQKARINQVEQRRLQALAARNEPLHRRLVAEKEREQEKLQILEAKSGQALAAHLKVAEAYFQRGDYNEVRTLANYLEPLVEEEEQKRSILFMRGMTYALQGQVDQALAAYEEFQSKDADDPRVENFLVAVGQMFLSNADPAKNDPQRAIEFFNRGLEKYPQGKLAPTMILQKATAQVALGQHDEALQTFNDFLSKNPNAPKEVKVQAEDGLATIYRSLGRWDEAVTAYRKIRDEYKEIPERAELAWYLAGFCLLQKGDLDGMITEMKAFVNAHPEGPYTSAVLGYLAHGHMQKGSTDEALAYYRQIIEKFPQSQEAKNAYFHIAAVYSGQERIDDFVKVLLEFTEKYPDDANVFIAYDNIAQTYARLQQIDDAVATYHKFLETNATSPNAPAALVKASELRRKQATFLGLYTGIDEETQKLWKQHMDESVALAEKAFADYPDSRDAALALQSLIETRQLLIEAELSTAEDTEKYFQELAGRFKDDPAARAKVQFALATFVHATEPQKAVQIMSEAYSPDVVFSPRGMEIYGISLISEGKLEEAANVFQKLQADYPIQPGTAPAHNPLHIQEAQASALYGLGRVLQEQKQLEESGKVFAQLKADYPWSPKALEADYGIAAAMRAEGRSDEALPILTRILRDTQRGTPELHGKTMLLIAHIHKTKGDMNSAIANFGKTAFAYEGVPAVAAEALWEEGQCRERRASQTSDPQKKNTDIEGARKAYNNLVTKFPKSEFTEQARKRLQALPAGR